MNLKISRYLQMYTDNTVLFAQSVYDLQSILDNIYTHSYKCDISVNIDKRKVCFCNGVRLIANIIMGML